MDGNQYHLISYQDIAKFFGITKSEVSELLGSGFAGMNMVQKGRLWNLIVAGATCDNNRVEELVKQWEDAKPKRPRSSIGYSQRERIIKRDRNKCRYCGKKLNRNNRVIDHVIPWSKGGRNVDENLVLACFSCNSQKRDEYLENTDLMLLPIPTE